MGERRSIRVPIVGTIAYWVVLASVKLGPAALAIYRATQGPKGSSSVSASFGNGGFSLKVIEKGATTYAASASWLVIAAWIALPPLIGWVAWAVLRKKDDRVSSPVRRG